MRRYDLFEYISQRKDGEMPCENEKLVLVSNVIRNATKDCGGHEAESSESNDDVGISINEREKRIAEEWAKKEGCWIPFEDIKSRNALFQFAWHIALSCKKNYISTEAICFCTFLFSCL